jgi:hypothetical protein
MDADNSGALVVKARVRPLPSAINSETEDVAGVDVSHYL